MKIEIDMSGRIEYTNKPTVIAGYGKSWHKTVYISSKNKRAIQKCYRSTNQPRVFNTELFCILIYFLIKDINCDISLIIDNEYPGHEKDIKKCLHDFYKTRKSHLLIQFKEIGKSSMAHYFAINEYRKRKDSKIVLLTDVFELIKKDR